VALALADGAIVASETAVIAETLRRMFGRAPSSALSAEIERRREPRVIPHAQVEAMLSPAERQLLLMQLAEVAAADGIVTDAERQALDELATRLRIAPAFVDAVLGARAPAAAPVAAHRSTCPRALCSVLRAVLAKQLAEAPTLLRAARRFCLYLLCCLLVSYDCPEAKCG